MAITVTAPQANKSFVGGEILDVTWSSNDVNVASFVVRLSTDNGATFNNVSGDLSANARSFALPLPVPPSSGAFQAIVRVASKDAAGNPVARGDSPVFEIRLALVDVTAPAGGSFDAAQSLKVDWDTRGPVSAHSVRLSTDGGATFPNVTPADLPGTARTFTFQLPSPAGSPVQAIVRVAAKDASGQQIAKDDSPAFTVRPITVSVTAPAGGAFTGGQILNVAWSTAGVVATHVVRLSTDGGATFNTVSGTLAGSDRSFSFQLPTPAAVSVQAVVRVVARDAAGNTLASGESPRFTLQQPTSVEVTTPAAGSVFDGGQSLAVTWITTGPATSHTVQISTNGGATYANATTTDLGSTVRTFTFNLPTPISQAQARVKVLARGAGGVVLAEGISGLFTIQPVLAGTTVIVTAPAANSTFQGGQSLKVDWNTVGPVSTHVVQISTNGGQTYTNTTTADLGSAVRTFTFNLPAPASQAQARIKVLAKGAGGAILAEGISGAFTIQPVLAGTTVTVTAPAANSTFQGGQSLKVDWNTAGPVSSHAVQISTNGGQTYANATTTDLGSAVRTFTFNLPALASQVQARVKVLAKGAGGTVLAEGVSGLFTIRPAVAGLQISPTSGPPGSEVVISGLTTAVLGARFGSIASPELLVEAPSSVTVEIPDGAVSGPILLELPGGGTLTTPPFTVTAAPNKPTVTAIDPACGVPGISVKITGTNFVLGQTIVRFKKAEGRVKAANVNVDPTGTFLTCTVPVGIVTGKVKVTTPNGRDFSPVFLLEPAVLTLTLLGGSRIAVGRASRLLAQGDNLPTREADYRVVSATADTAVPGVTILLVERRPTYDEVPLPAPNAAFFFGTEAPFALLSKAGEKPVLELLIQVDAGVPAGTYRLRAQVCRKVVFAQIQIAAAAPRSLITLPGASLASPLVLPDALPDPSFAALQRLVREGKLADLLKRFLSLVIPPVFGDPPPSNPEGITRKRDFRRRGSSPIPASGTVLPQVKPAPRDLDGDCLPETFEQEIARAFVPSYVVSQKEKPGFPPEGTGFAKFEKDQTIRMIRDRFLATQPVVHFRVKPLGITGTSRGRRAFLQIDYFTLWTRDDGLPNVPDFALPLAEAIFKFLKFHDNEEERSAVLVAATLAADEPNRYPIQAGAYEALEFFVTAHEGTIIDQTTYLPASGVKRIQLFLSLSKHGTYEKNPDYFPLLGRSGQIALALVAAGLAATKPDEKIEIAAASAVTALVVGFFFLLAVERLPKPTAPLLPQDNNLINVGESDPGRQINGATWIRETMAGGGRDLLPKLTEPLWTVNNPIVAEMADFVFTPQTGLPGVPVSIFGDGFANVTAVQFCNMPAPFTVVSPNLIRTVVPAGAATGPIRVTTSGTFRRSRDLFTVCPGDDLPKVSFFSPAEGGEGTQVEIVGENLGGATQVVFGTTPAPFVVSSPTSITAYVPIRLAVGNPDLSNQTITVRIGSTTASRAGFKVLAPKSTAVLNFRITGFDPAVAPEGSDVSIFGAELETVTTVRFGRVAAQPTSVSRNLVKVKVPAGAELAPITVVRSAGISREATSQGTFVPAMAAGAPVIERFTPALGPVASNGGTRVRLYVLNRDNVSRVKFGGKIATQEPSDPLDPQSRFVITASVPPEARPSQLPLDFPIELAPARGDSGPTASARNFVVSDDPGASQPAIGNLSPLSGRVGTEVTITGSGFNGVISVLFDGVESCFRVPSPTTIIAMAPPNFASGPVTVVTGSGTVLSAQVFTVTNG